MGWNVGEELGDLVLVTVLFFGFPDNFHACIIGVREDMSDGFW